MNDYVALQAGLEDWELSKIRVNLLQKADASDLLERLSMLQPLAGRHQSTERNKLQGLFSRGSSKGASLQRCVTLTFALTCLTSPIIHCIALYLTY